jgi:rod shape-determining protein MreC
MASHWCRAPPVTKMFKRHYIALALVVLLVLVLFSLPTQTLTKFKLAISSLFLPLFGLAGSTQQATERIGDSVLSRKELVRQNEQLRRENEQLRLRDSQSQEIWRENHQLRQLVNWQRQNAVKYKLARVVARDPANWWRTVQINLGSRDGVRVSFPVRTMDGLVGRISAVGDTRSQVLLLGDPTLRVAAVIRETRETGIIFSGSSNPLENNMVDLGYLSRTSEIKPGQWVETSGDGGFFPKGILIGQIVDARPADHGLAMEARVKLFAKINSLEEVWVMVP